jgi:uncharacterized membrane protein YbaN (DUF454 family)
MIPATVILLWRLLAVASLLLGVVGLILPVVPTVPFLLVSAWAAGNGWPWLEERLLAHPHCGPIIKRWRARRAIPRMGKWWATIGMTGSAAGLAFFAPIPLGFVLGIAGTMLIIGVWIWSRPDA